MNLKEVKKGLLETLKEIFPEKKYKFYAKEVVEGYERPSFFTQIVPVEMEPENYNTRKCRVTFYIYYMQESTDEVEMMDVIDKIRNAFNLYVIIGNRAVDVNGIEWQYTGEERNIPEIALDISWMEKIEHENSAEIMRDFYFRKEMEE